MTDQKGCILQCGETSVQSGAKTKSTNTMKLLELEHGRLGDSNPIEFDTWQHKRRR